MEPRACPWGSIGPFFAGEDLEYEIGFGPFKRVALGKLTFRAAATKGQYEAVLQTETLGVAGWVARYRVDTYRSMMEEVEGRRRLRSLCFEEDVKIGNRVRWRKHLFDYEKRKWITDRRRKNGTLARAEHAIPPGIAYDDFLTAAYNFRFGIYGAVERGKEYTIPTFPRKGTSSYAVRVAPREEEEQRKRLEATGDGKDYFVRLSLDPEITHSKEGVVEGWLSEDLVPIEGAIKDVLLIADVTGKLVRRTKV